MTDKILRCRDVQEATGLSRSTIYRMMERDDFPKASKLGGRAIGWRAKALCVTGLRSVAMDWKDERTYRRTDLLERRANALCRPQTNVLALTS